MNDAPTPAPDPSARAGEEEYDRLVAQRVQKLEQLRDLGIAPYGARYSRTHLSGEALSDFENLTDSTIRLAGRILSKRVMGKASFVHILDDAGRIQLFFRRDRIGAESYQVFRGLVDIGDFIGAEGKLFRTRTGEVTLEVERWEFLTKALRPLPEKWHGLTDVEARYRQRHLDIISNQDVAAVFRVRTKVVSAVRRFLDDRGFTEVETPVLQPLYGGASARPFVTHHNALDRELYLRIATELYLKRMIIAGFEKVYEIGRVFRNEGISTKHNPEYTLLETYEAYADYSDVMEMVEQLVYSVATHVLGHPIVAIKDRSIDLTPPWSRKTLRDAIMEATGIDFYAHPDQSSLYQAVAHLKLTTVNPASPRGKIIDELLSNFVEPKLTDPTFLTDYPVELSPLAKRKADNADLVERFEAFIGGVEIANAFSELNDPYDQRERFAQQSLDRAAGDDEAQPLDEEFIRALEHGMPPTGGLGIGIDRLTMLITNQSSIREVILFPTLRTRA